MLAEDIKMEGISPPEAPVAYPLAFERVREKISLFGGLSDRQQNLIFPYLNFASFSRGDCVFKQGQLPGNIYIVLSGEVQLQVSRQDESCVSVSYLPGDCFGETSVIGIQPQLGSAHVAKDTQVIVLSRACLMEVSAYDPEMFGILMMNLAREISRRFHSSLMAEQGCEVLPVMRA